MSATDREIALGYLRTPPGAPWRWEDEGRALVWRDGATIAFREELALVFERLAPGGLPPFPSLVCVLAACRGRYLEFPGAAKAATDAQASRLAIQGALMRRSEQLAEEQLRKLATLPREVIGTPRGKALLAQVLFEAAAREGGAEAARVAAGLQCGLGERELNGVATDAVPLDVAGTIHRAAQPLRAHTADSLRLRLKTGLEALPGKGPEITLPRGERARRLLAKLEEDAEHPGLALLVRDLMAAIRLPAALARTDEQAAGGASGMGNRGTLDRLLLSELAHDDLTLATRVALNEALYLHREPPARRPRRGLALLLDSGLRLWGVPRVLAAATGLALLAGWPDGAAARAWRAEDEGLTEVDLLEGKALAGHLAALGLGLDPGRALPAFAARVAEGGEMDAVIVTHREALRSEVFRRRLAQPGLTRAFLVLLDHEGLVQLHALPWGGARPLAEMRADLAKLAGGGRKPGAKAPAAQSLIDPALANDLPAIFRVSPFPLLLPVVGKLERTVGHGRGGLCVTADKRLLHWTQPNQGARLLLADLPGGRTCLLHGAKDGRITVVRGRDGSGKMAVIGLEPDAGAPNITRLTGPQQPPGVYLDRAALLLVQHTRVAAVALDASTVLAETQIPEGLRPLGGRYFVDHQDLWFASWDGAQVRWDQTDMGKHVRGLEITAAFERDGIGPWVLMRDRRILSPGGGEWMRLEFEPGAVEALPGGNQLVVSDAKAKGHRLVDLGTRREWPINMSRPADPATGLVRPPLRQLQSRLQAIYAAPGQPLRLRTHKGRWLEIFPAPDGLRLVAAVDPGGAFEPGAKLFVETRVPAGLGCGLKRTTWSEGSTAWLDDRGLLHLRSRNQDLPEITLTLGMGTPVAAWTSDGTVAGPEFFTGVKTGATSAEVLSLLSRFSNALC